MRRSITHALRIAAIIATSGSLLFLGASAFVQLRYAGRISRPAEAPPAPVALVFGAGLSRSVPSPLLAERLNMGIALYRQGKAQKLLVSGDNSDRYHDETAAMKRYIVEHGVPAADVIEDEMGLSTYDSCARARLVFKLERALLVTQRFHLPRALFIANSLGLDAYGVAADPEPHRASPYLFRELVSRPVALAMVLARPDPAGTQPPP
jgi:SanA protein